MCCLCAHVNVCVGVCEVGDVKVKLNQGESQDWRETSETGEQTAIRMNEKLSTLEQN